MRAYRIIAAACVLTALITVEAAAQTEPEAPRPPEVLLNGFQLSATGGLSMNHIVGEYYGDCPCEFYGNTTSTSPYFGASLNIPVFEDAALLLRVGINNSSSSWETGRNDSLWTSPEIGTIFSNLTFEYELLSFDVLARLIGAMDGPRLLVGPSFSAVKRKHLRIVDEEFVSGAQRVVEDGDLQVDQETRISMILGFEYAFTPVHNLYVIPSFEVDYPFAKLLNQDGVDPDFSLRPIFYRLLVSVSYQLF